MTRYLSADNLFPPAQALAREAIRFLFRPHNKRQPLVSFGVLLDCCDLLLGSASNREHSDGTIVQLSHPWIICSRMQTNRPATIEAPSTFGLITWATTYWERAEAPDVVLAEAPEGVLAWARAVVSR